MGESVVAPAFRLLRYFSIASFVCILAATAAIGLAYRHLAMEDFMRLGEHLNEDLSAIFANLLWQEHASFVAQAASLPSQELRDGTQAKRLDAAVRRMMEGHSLVRVKLYAPNGLTVYSTEPGQIGDPQGANPGFLAALGGRTVSELIYRDSFSAFDRRIENRNLISSYVPLRASPEQPVGGVLELYEDVTPLLDRMHGAQLRASIGVAAVLLVLYGVLFLVVYRAHAIIDEQRMQLKQAVSARASDIAAAANHLNLLALALEQSPAPAMITDVKGEVAYVNPAFDDGTWRPGRYYPLRDETGRITHVVHWQHGS